MKNKDTQLLEEAYQLIYENEPNTLYDKLMKAFAEGESSLEEIVQTMASAINFAITSIDDIIGEAGYEGLPETKQENLHKAVSLLQNIK